ncbi:MAG: hypothetical protein AB2L09_07405 [Coriobacteriia bacterium]
MSAYTGLLNIPLSINTAYGDAFQSNQWADTLHKVQDVAGSAFRGETMVGTKHPISREMLEQLAGIKDDLWIFIAVTGLGENVRFTLDRYAEFYRDVCDIFPKTVCAIRPVIPGRNNTMTVLGPILDMVASGAGLLTFGGYRDPSIKGSPKYNDEAFNQLMCRESEQRGIVVRDKCACIVSHVTKQPCRLHHDGMPQNLETLRSLGYDVISEADAIRIVGFNGSGTVSKGDLSFARLLIASSRIDMRSDSPSEIMQLRTTDGRPLVCTSSFFDWARQVPCQLACDYCFADLSRGYGIPLTDFGDNPVRIIPD